MNSQSNSDENIRNADNLHSSSSQQVKGRMGATKMAAVEDNIPSRHRHHHHEKSKMKKPDMPIYIPRGRRLAAESELPKLGEEKKPDRMPWKLELGTEIQECNSESSLFSQEQNSILGSSEQEPIAQIENANTLGEVKKKSHGKKKTLKTVAADSFFEESHGHVKARSGQAANGRQKNNLIQTGVSSHCMSNVSVEVVNASTGNGGISVTAASDISEAKDTVELSANTDNSCEQSANANYDSTEPLFASFASGDASGMSATLVTTVSNVLDTYSDSLERNHDLDHSSTNCTELVMTGDTLSNENMTNCLGKPSSPVYAGSESNVGLAASDEQSWDALFDDSGEALHPDVMNQITESLGTVNVQKPQFDYLNYQPKEPEIDEEEFEHLIEIYDFPASLQTVDLVMAFKDFQATGFEIKWVDDTHAIGVFSGQTAAKSALETFHNPFIKVRPIQHATRQTKVKAKKCTEFLLPYKPRPVTVASVARLMVTKALGVSEPVSKEKREEERQKIKTAREQKRTTKRQKEDAWEGKIGKCAMDET